MAGQWLLQAVRRAKEKNLLCVYCLCACSLAVSACGVPEDIELGYHGLPIINGSPDYNPAHKAVVALSFGDYMCTGTLISSDVILTAGHCVEGFGPSAYTVYFGNNLSSSDMRYVSEVKLHPHYNAQTITNDIAMLRLSSAPPAGVEPVPYLPHSMGIMQADLDNPLEFVGFGQTETYSTGVKLTVTNDLDWICTTPGGCIVGAGYGASENTICEDQSPGGPCHGDSGGPAFVVRSGQEYVAGVTSYGDQYCQYFGCSTKVDEFEDFIADFVGGVLGSNCNGAVDCLSGYCVDGICCESACSGTCMACNMPGSLGSCVPAADGTPCPDGNACNGQETCQARVCVAGEPPDCDDNNVCTEDSCDPATGCVYNPVGDGLPCPDGDACNGEEYCRAGICIAGTELDCDDANPCTDDACNPYSGCTHSPVAEGTDCSGGPCGPSSCRLGHCVPTDTSICDDGDPCTMDSCTPETGCINETLPDGHECGGCRMCISGQCIIDDKCVVGGGCGCSSPAPLSTDAAGQFLLLVTGVLFLMRRNRRN